MGGRISIPTRHEWASFIPILLQTYKVSLHLLDLDFDGVQGFAEQLALFHDGYGHGSPPR